MIKERKIGGQFSKIAFKNVSKSLHFNSQHIKFKE